MQAGLSQDQLIERIYTVAGLELPYPRASEWETGKRKPTARQLQAIARALGCAVSDLLPEED